MQIEEGSPIRAIDREPKCTLDIYDVKGHPPHEYFSHEGG